METTQAAFAALGEHLAGAVMTAEEINAWIEAPEPKPLPPEVVRRLCGIVPNASYTAFVELLTMNLEDEVRRQFPLTEGEALSYP